MKSSRSPLVLVLAVLLVVTGLVSSWSHATNPTRVGSGTVNPESTALYCAGLTDAKGVASGRVIFENASAARREVTVLISSDAQAHWSGSLTLKAHSRASLTPSALVKGHNFGVAAQVSGTGVVAEMLAANNSAASPCVSHGVAQWYATGFDTLVGSSAFLSIVNPTATPAVFSVSIFNAKGFAAPAPFQGLSVAPHGEVIVNLGTQVVNTANVGVHVRVLRGALAITGVQSSHGVTSFVQGAQSLERKLWFASVTTVNRATAQVRLANPHDTPVSVSVKVNLANFSPASQQVELAPYATGVVTITPNPAIAPDAYGALAVSSSRGVVADLAVGDGTFEQLSAAPTPVASLTVEDFTGRGFDAARVTNTSTHRVRLAVTGVSLATSSGPLSSEVTTHVTLDAGATISLTTLVAQPVNWATTKIVVSTTRAVLVAGLTLPTKPAGDVVLAALNGG
ncbi:MAG TPA: DUF5719 family protein [Acidimicrobiales bacterium]|nr:DUF5719 family protein [Acidimicrobiales bacterium]